MTKFQRLREVALFKTLGASSRTIMRAAGARVRRRSACSPAWSAPLGASVLSWALARYVLDMPWRAGAGGRRRRRRLTGAMVAVVGVVASLDVLRRKPLAVLRAG